MSKKKLQLKSLFQPQPNLNPLNKSLNLLNLLNRNLKPLNLLLKPSLQLLPNKRRSLSPSLNLNLIKKMRMNNLKNNLKMMRNSMMISMRIKKEPKMMMNNRMSNKLPQPPSKPLSHKSIKTSLKENHKETMTTNLKVETTSNKVESQLTTRKVETRVDIKESKEDIKEKKEDIKASKEDIKVITTEMVETRLGKTEVETVETAVIKTGKIIREANLSITIKAVNHSTTNSIKTDNDPTFIYLHHYSSTPPTYILIISYPSIRSHKKIR